jgi:hypothetical protein
MFVEDDNDDFRASIQKCRGKNERRTKHSPGVSTPSSIAISTNNCTITNNAIVVAERLFSQQQEKVSVSWRLFSSTLFNRMNGDTSWTLSYDISESHASNVNSVLFTPILHFFTICAGSASPGVSWKTSKNLYWRVRYGHRPTLQVQFSDSTSSTRRTRATF